MISKAVMVMGFVLIFVCLAAPSDASAQGDLGFCWDFDPCTLGHICDEDVDGWNYAGGSSNCNWAWWYYCEEYGPGGRCDITVDVSTERARAKLAWTDAYVDEVEIAGVGFVISAEVPPNLPALDHVDGWVASLQAEYAARRRAKITEKPQGNMRD